MKGYFNCKLTAGVIITSSFLYCGTTLSAESNTLESADKNGFSRHDDTTNETDWGLGLGVGFEKKPYTGMDSDVSPFPLVYFNNKWIKVLGNRLELKAGEWDDIKLSLQGEYAFSDGYKASDAPILDGMKKRNGGFWVGPAVEWDTNLGTISAKYLLAGNNGQKAALGFTKAFHYGSFTFTPHTEIEWLNGKYVDYYYGVNYAETRPGRNIYNGSSTYNISAGLRSDYSFTSHQSMSLDASIIRLGSGITDSPLVDKTTIPQVTLSYLYRF
ncbi:MAG: MipA/OmpV family protein [Serratia inhibens]|uniref:MipA/OmpV family protein n=1 Tax=Serratia inhibens TaxID=2338073 RepID=UPI003C7D0577